ncbi:polyprenyl diphosphate synthase [uncultured Rikenella sp.]|uniref:polyprenyl diphosphate synthase n=1 Tax=uncultured Rikenella sp. TaxID=368003 RepID=UPI0025F64ACC|nr:polyprenyl diphosphate synthase [uncultured Rikenella sp.]
MTQKQNHIPVREPASGSTPRHVAVIMDGNGRWAKGQGEERLYGHRHGVDTVREVVRTAAEAGIEYLTIYAFSTENWGRPEAEVDGIMSLIAGAILSELDTLTGAGIRMNFIGDLASLPQALRESIRKARAADIPDEKLRMTLNVALNYSARWELTEATRQIGERIRRGDLTPEEITPELISAHLTTAGMPDPELLIRTSGEQRLSNFLLWQLSYTELYFTETLWPEFDGAQFTKALEAYRQRERRFGRL